MRTKLIARLLPPLLLIFSISGAALAQAAPPAPLKVATRVVPPFVLKKDDALAGFSIDLWQALAAAINAKSSFAEVQTLPELLGAVESRSADVAIAAISITSEREEKFDFSHPMFESGLQILVRSDGGASGLNARAVWQSLSSGPALELLALLAAFILIPAHIVWFFERGRPGSIVERGYVNGILHSIWWAAGAAGAQQLDWPRSAVGRLVSGLYIFVSVIFVAYFTAAVTAGMTVQQLKGDISGPDDLPGKKIASVVGSTSAGYLKAAAVNFTEFPRVDQALKALEERSADAVVFDAPVLLYYAAHEGKGKTNVVGQVFRKENYGLLFPPASPLRKPVNEALLKLRENGVYESLYKKWFGAEGGG